MRHVLFVDEDFINHPLYFVISGFDGAYFMSHPLWVGIYTKPGRACALSEDTVSLVGASVSDLSWSASQSTSGLLLDVQQRGKRARLNIFVPSYQFGT